MVKSKAAAQKAKKAPAKKTKAKTVKGKPTREEVADLNQTKKAAKKAAAPAARPVNHKDEALEKLVAWLKAGMAKVKQRLEHDMPKMLRDRPASELAHLFAATRDMSTTTGEALKSLSDAASTLSNVMIPKAFENENITSFNTKDGYRVTVSTAYRASIKADRKVEAYEYLKANGLGDLITETVNAGTLSAAGKAMVEEKGIELPGDLFNAAYMPTTSLTKVTKK